LPPRRCPYCHQPFQPSKFRPDQTVCSDPACQRQRRAAQRRAQLAADPEYAQVVRDSQKKWREAHPDYQMRYREAHPEAVERNRQKQRERDCKQRLANLVKNNLALDLKLTATEAWLVGPAAADLVKNNLAFSKLFIFQSTAHASPVSAGS
jgi:hypothetical protein